MIINKKFITNIIFVLLFTIAYKYSNGCTTAIINGKASKNSVPILWKNRDTNYLSNKAIFIREKPFNYIALVNANETSGRWVYAGLNSVGFGIINSVAYNLPINNKEQKDLEGLIMADALRSCMTTNDFEKYLIKNQGTSLGSQANFGVIDHQGNALIFEVYNHGYYKINSLEYKKNYIINSNFSRNGEKSKGTGYLRFNRATELFNKIDKTCISAENIFRCVSRDFNNVLLHNPSINDLKRISYKKSHWVLTRDSIDRSYTSAAIVIEGKTPYKLESVATFWVLIGEPITSIAVPLWTEAKTTPEVLFKGKDSLLYKESLRIQKIVRPFNEIDKKEYLDISKIDNKEKKGYLPELLKCEREIFKQTRKFLKSKHTRKEFSDFQNKMANIALNKLRKINNI